MKKGLKIFSLICALLTVLTALCGCERKLEGIEIRDAQSAMLAGSTQTLNVYDMKTEEKLDSESLIFAVGDPSVLTVDSNGTVTAVAPGSTTVYVQHKENKLRAEITIDVRYRIISIPRYDVKNPNTSVSGDQYAFWSKKGYQNRVSDWNVLDVAKILITKGCDDYVFSDVYDYKNIVGEEVILISDWTNSDVPLDSSVLEGNPLSFIAEKYQLGNITKDSLSEASADLKSAVTDQIQSYQGTVYLSRLPKNMEYRVYVSYDYNIVKVNNFYSRGILMGIWQLGSDLFGGNISGLLNSYTYSETQYEIVHAQNAKIVIESRLK